MERKSWYYLIIPAIFAIAVFELIIGGCHKDEKASLPVVSTAAVSNISTTTAVCGGNVTDNGGSDVYARGVCWSEGMMPSTSGYSTYNGKGTGSFSTLITGLKGGTKYYVRAYATNKAGTGYGPQQVFTTQEIIIDTSYFPIAVWLQSPSSASAYRDNGINMFIGLWNELDQNQLNLLRSAHMKVICAQNSFGLDNLSDTLIYGWMHGDEPDNAQWNAALQKYDPCIDPAIIIQDYETIKQNDPSRPVYLNLGQGVSYINYIGRGACRANTDMYKVSNNGYLKGCDIGSFDIYPVNNSDSETSGNLWYVAKGIDNLIAWSDNSKPVWCWIETTKISENSSAKPTPFQVKAEVWMALIHGAKGFGYFCHIMSPSFDEAALLHDPTMIQAVKDINEQVTSLASVLNSTSTNQYATVNSSNNMVPVDFMTKNYGGANYIIAVGMRPGVTTATFNVTSGTQVEVIGEGRNLDISGGSFNDSFTSYDVHIYKITP